MLGYLITFFVNFSIKKGDLKMELEFLITKLLCKQVAFFVYCLIVPFLLSIIGIGLIYLEHKKRDLK